MVGLRFNLASFDGNALSGPDAPRLLARIKAMDWFAQVHARDDQWAAAVPFLRDSRAKVLVDHFGIPQPISSADAPGFRAVLDLARTGRAVVEQKALQRLRQFRVGDHLDRGPRRHRLAIPRYAKPLRPVPLPLPLPVPG